jgi:hypothetical protein
MKRPVLLPALLGSCLAVGIAGSALAPGLATAPAGDRLVADAAVAPVEVTLPQNMDLAGRTVGAQLAAKIAAQKAAQQAARKAQLEAAAKARREAAAKRASRSRRVAHVAYGSPRAIARAQLADRGWSDQFSCLDSLWQRESGWNTYASNPSGAYGIPQALPGSKMASAGDDWRTNPATQIRWGLGYIGSRYGGPCAAWHHSQANGWY